MKKKEGEYNKKQNESFYTISQEIKFTNLPRKSKDEINFHSITMVYLPK